MLRMTRRNSLYERAKQDPENDVLRAVAELRSDEPDLRHHHVRFEPLPCLWEKVAQVPKV
jgi:hypothetical protein